MTTVPPGADRLIVCISDIEMGAGGVTDDFPHPVWLARLIDGYDDVPVSVDFVFNGDTFDLLKTAMNDGSHPHHITHEVACEKFGRIQAAHKPFFDAMARALSRSDRRALFVLGNHDQDLLFPELQRDVTHRIGGRAEFPGFSVGIGDCWIEHGSQQDPLFRVDPDQPFVMVDGRRFLALPWAAVALLDVAIPLQPQLYHYDRLKPRDHVLDLLPELKDLLANAYWEYWTRDSFDDWFGGGHDPIKKLDWYSFREIMYRFSSSDIDVHNEADWLARMKADKRYRVFLLGHEHKPSWVAWGDRKVLRTGAFRNEYMVENDGLQQTPLPKVYAEIWQRDGQTIQSELVERACPPAPEGYVPSTIYGALGAIRRLQRSAAHTARVRAAREQQERQEKGGIWPWSS